MTVSRLNIRVRAILHKENGEEVELFDTAVDVDPEELKREARQISPTLRKKILKYLDNISL